MRAALILAAGIAAGSVRAADAITVDFAGAPDQPWLQLVGDATVEGGVLKTSPLAGWQRSGLYVGPLPVGEAPWHIEYDVRPVAYGDQCQEFVSVTPSTHWYMAYGRPDGRVNLHTRSQDEWKARSSSTAVLELGRWYRVSVELGATSIRLRIREREGQGDLWDSGDTPVDSLGQETVFGLIDEAATAVGATEWDNLVVSTDDPRIAEQMAQRMRDLEAERRAMEQRREDARKLREAGIALIPMPQQVALPAGGRGCRLSGTVQVGGGTEEQRGVVVAALAERLGLDAQSARTGGIIRLTGLPPDGPPELQGEQAYTLTVAEGRVEIGARAPVGVFYATQTLCQLADPQGNLPPVRLADWPAIENRLVMIAVCQGAFQVIDVEYWKRIIRELSAVKVTHIQVYFEGATFTSERYPFLGLKGPDGLTLEKGKTLSEYAKAHFIELLPQQNSLGHAGTILSHEELANLRESGDVFCSSKPETFEFLGNLYDELLQAFPYATWVHVGGDEFAHGFAQCPQCKQRAAEIGPEGLYAEHMMKLREMLAQRGRKMMIWWHEQGYTEQAADRLAKDLAVFDWHYGNQPSYPSLERLQNAGFAETWATPAITRYYDGSNDWDNTFGNVSGFLRAGAQRKVPGECTCTWVHGIWGGRNLFELNLYGLLFSADCAWNGGGQTRGSAPTDGYADYRARFGQRWFGLGVGAAGQTHGSAPTDGYADYRARFGQRWFGLGVGAAGQTRGSAPTDGYADYRARFGQRWFGLGVGAAGQTHGSAPTPAPAVGADPRVRPPDGLEEQVRLAIHTPYGEPKAQGFWRDNRVLEEMLAAPLAKTAEEIAARPEIVAEAETLLTHCAQANSVLAAWEQTATRNQVTIKYLRHDVLIHETAAHRLVATANLLEAYDRAKALPANQREATLAEPLQELEAVVAAYRTLEQGFKDSVLEAGGGESGWGGWYPYVAGGGIMFRAQTGREETEKTIAHIRELLPQETLPTTPFVE